jgi:hypothetical protein
MSGNNTLKVINSLGESKANIKRFGLKSLSQVSL